jgi:hypothetical protein
VPHFLKFYIFLPYFLLALNRFVHFLVILRTHLYLPIFFMWLKSFLPPDVLLYYICMTFVKHILILHPLILYIRLNMLFGVHMQRTVIIFSGILCLVVLLACGIVCSGLCLRKLLLVSFDFSLYPNPTSIRRLPYAHCVYITRHLCNTYCLIVQLL